MCVACVAEAVKEYTASRKETEIIFCYKHLRRLLMLRYLNNRWFFNIIEDMTGGSMIKDRVEEVLKDVRVGLKSEGGDIELIDVKDDIVYVRLKGACGTCPMSTLTMKNVVESSIRAAIPEIKAVQAI